MSQHARMNPEKYPPSKGVRAFSEEQQAIINGMIKEDREADIENFL